MRACPVGSADKGACARCFSGFPTSGFGRRSERYIGRREVEAEGRSPGVRERAVNHTQR